MKAELLGRSLKELRELATGWGLEPYRGNQIYHALYAEGRFRFGEITSLPKALRQQLAELASITLPQIVRRCDSQDGTRRYVFSLEPEDSPRREAATDTVESVFMPDMDDARPMAGRDTLCISSQAGCAVDCRFCMTATLGLRRNLTAGEIAGQVLAVLADNQGHLLPRFGSPRHRQTNIVLMGQGEPLFNYNAVMAAVRLFCDTAGLNFSQRHLTLSTSGVVPGIQKMAQETLRPKLAVSLNATTSQTRTRIMPINKKYPLEQLIEVCRLYPLRPWERLTFEYVLLKDVNDSDSDARRLLKLVSKIRCKVNLIPLNPGPAPRSLPFEPPTPERVIAFQKILTSRSLLAFIRRPRGQDVQAACGQLALIEGSPT
jgi:23S rRNA (adenine2503-C2)-methyltransferase